MLPATAAAAAVVSALLLEEGVGVGFGSVAGCSVVSSALAVSDVLGADWLLKVKFSM